MKLFLRNKENDMIDFLEKLVNVDSGSMNKTGVDQIGSILKEQYESMGFIAEVRPQEIQGDHLVLRHKNAVNPEIMTASHLDTVFGEGEVAKRPFTIQGRRAYGPGVMDMKGSHVALLYAIKSLYDKGDRGIENVEILLTSDEEIGSPTSRALIEERTVGKKYALITEPARQDGSLVTARRGAGSYTLKVTGKAAHAGVQPKIGKSAIEELAHKIIALHQLTNHETGISVNVGVIEGGTTINTIAASAVGHVDVRISKIEQAEWIENEIKKICATPTVEGTRIELMGGIERPPMVKNDQTIALLNEIQSVGDALGIEVKDVSTGGSSDASFTSAKGIPTIDGLGPIGGLAHSEDEYLELDSLVERTLLLAKTISRLTKEK